MQIESQIAERGSVMHLNFWSRSRLLHDEMAKFVRTQYITAMQHLFALFYRRQKIITLEFSFCVSRPSGGGMRWKLRPEYHYDCPFMGRHCECIGFNDPSHGPVEGAGKGFRARTL